MVRSSIDQDVTRLATRLAGAGGEERASVYAMSFWSERLLGWAMEQPPFKTALFRFVDVFPATRGDEDVLRHLAMEMTADTAPWPVRAGLRLADGVPRLGAWVAAGLARSNIERMAQQFIVGQEPGEAADRLQDLWADGIGFVVDLLGEKTVTEAQADRYAARVDELVRTLLDRTRSWPPAAVQESDDIGPRPRVSVSIKPTALASLFGPLTREDGLAQAAGRLRPVLKLAAERGAQVWFDMEHLDVKDLTIELFQALLSEPELAALDAGIVVQAYLREARHDLAGLIEWSAGRVAAGHPPVAVRLVKGAYWDAETIHARAAGWEPAVFQRKVETDASYERCVELLHDHHGEVRAAFASHNLRSLAYAIAHGRRRGIPDGGYELQMLYGMAEPIQRAIRDEGLRLKVYAPVGELVPGMAYLVRRLLENTSNESFVRQRFAEGRDLKRLLRAPRVRRLPDPAPLAHRADTDARQPGDYAPEPPAEWHRSEVRAAFAAAVEAMERRGLGRDVPAVVAGRNPSPSGRGNGGDRLVSLDPADGRSVVATTPACGRAEADEAVRAGQRAFHEWSGASARDRAAVLFGAAADLRHRRHELAALEVFEAGKPWADADADVCEAIDFCEYYGREALRLDAGGLVQSPPGEHNRLTYQARGVVAVISPWNFPLAIPAGMVTAALVAGNAVCFKPAEQTPAIAYELVRALDQAGLPEGVLSFLPGRGEEVGAALVEHPGVAGISFTGSREVGLGIVAAAAVHRPGQCQVKRVIAEMGGKNPAYVDADADLDGAVPAIVASAFGFAGQKCSALSRLIVHEAVHDELLERLVGAAGELRVDHPRSMGTQMGPLIDADAQAKVRSYVDVGRADGRVVLARDDVPPDGFFAGPTLVADVPATSRLATEEVFGPVLAVFEARDVDHALALANDTPYALTAGVFSRSPSTIERFGRELRAGNVYVNRGTTGAVVGRQPFGGFGLSGVGSKAGGPDYLAQFLEPRVVTENTVRQGFSPDLA